VCSFKAPARLDSQSQKFMAPMAERFERRKDRQYTGCRIHQSHHARGARSRDSWDSIFHTIARNAQTPLAKQRAIEIAANFFASGLALHWCFVREYARLLCAALPAALKTNP